MYILVFFIVLGLTTYVINKMNSIESNIEFLKWTKRDMLIMAGLFLLAVILQCLDFIIPIFFILVYAFVATITLVYVNKNREKTIQAYKEQVAQVYEAISSIEKQQETIDYNQLPFQIHKEGNQINSITCKHTDPKKHTDSNCTNVVYSLKNYFPYYDWTYSIDYPKQLTTFTGQKLPPQVAYWPGSDLRHSLYIPVGVSGNGEVGLDLGAKEQGESLYVYEDGKEAGTTSLPTAPQWLTIGSTGGGKAIWDEQELW